MIFYDAVNNRLVSLKQESDSVFWDNHWRKQNLLNVIKNPPRNRFVVKTTKKYLAQGSRILEAGCGMGDKVYSLQEAGFDAYGVDIAQDTVRTMLKLRPEINIEIADVRKLPFSNEYFDGYWSLGVIEHFYDGYDKVSHEMKRIIRRGGYVFLSFPHMSLLRKFKVKKNKYLYFTESKEDLSKFYQFIFDSDKVKNDIERLGFTLIDEYGQGGLKGLKDEIKFFRPVLQRVYDGKSVYTKALHMGLNAVLSKWTGHTKFMVFRKST